MTLLLILEMLDLRRRRSAPGPLRIMLVGAACEVDQPWGELLPFTDWEVIELILIGPLARGPEFHVISQPDLGRRISLKVIMSTLQDIQGDLGKFHFAIAFNSGMIHYPTWPAALLRLRAFGCPLAVTAWVLHEVAGVYQLLKDAGFAPSRVTSNPFASRAPQRVACCQGTVCFCNRALLLASPSLACEWRPLLELPENGIPRLQDIEDALRLLQGRAEVVMGIKCPLEAVLEDPDGFQAELRA
eukprot:CAMPEP_0170205244 /NCGR_PEP_ID=MMETSP0116_2-20130129/2161_1 /TAXON_ID=400756 /ORGANISM="Durinskia baltica, Strain CSIRO CS-38" /LENGTH=243 /DNA_ID=CAMNT_0010455625 /DNA_START=10 /DNA_END=737 /DNA_ORIENTATION=-